MCGLFYTWHGWIALAVMLAAGFGTLYRWRYLLEQWMIGLGAAAVLLLGVSAGHLVSHYEGTVIDGKIKLYQKRHLKVCHS